MEEEILADDIRNSILQKLKDVMQKNPHLDPIKWFENHPLSEVEIKQLSGGYMNYVVRVRFGPEAQKQSVVIKYAPPYVRVSGPSMPAPANRIDMEYKCITKFEEIWPGSGPNPYYCDVSQEMFLMEDLHDYKVLKFAMMEGEVDKVAFNTMGKMLAKIHSKTHVSNLSPEEFQQLQDQFNDRSMLELNAKYIFDKPYDADDVDNSVEPQVRDKAEMIRKSAGYLAVNAKYRPLYISRRDCLVHGDLHNGSVMVKGSNPRFFDNEWCAVGFMCYDLAMLIGHCIMSHHYHMLTPKDNDKHRRVAYKILDCIYDLVKTYLENLQINVPDREQYLADFFSDMAAMMGMEIATRTFGCAHSEDVKGWGDAELEILESGVRLVHAHTRIHDIHFLLNIALMLC